MDKSVFKEKSSPLFACLWNSSDPQKHNTSCTYCQYDILKCSAIFLCPPCISPFCFTLFAFLYPPLSYSCFTPFHLHLIPSHLSLPPLFPSHVLPTVVSTFLHLTPHYLPLFFPTLFLSPNSPSLCPVPLSSLSLSSSICGTESFAIHRASNAKDLSAAHSLPTPDCDLYAQVVDALA